MKTKIKIKNIQKLIKQMIMKLVIQIPKLLMKVKNKQIKIKC